MDCPENSECGDNNNCACNSGYKLNDDANGCVAKGFTYLQNYNNHDHCIKYNNGSKNNNINIC